MPTPDEPDIETREVVDAIDTVVEADVEHVEADVEHVEPEGAGAESADAGAAVHAELDDRLAELDGLSARPLHEHAELYHGLHADLQAALAEIDNA